VDVLCVIAALSICWGALLVALEGLFDRSREHCRSAIDSGSIGFSRQTDAVCIQVQRLRQDYLAALRRPQHRSQTHQHLVQTTRQAVARRGYFRHLNEELEENESMS
jgi:hypothetical protein